jgi:hypothetical protein
MEEDEVLEQLNDESFNNRVEILEQLLIKVRRSASHLNITCTTTKNTCINVYSAFLTPEFMKAESLADIEFECHTKPWLSCLFLQSLGNCLV